jgi:putative transposase
LFPSVRLAISRATRRAPARFRIVEFSVQRDHVHLIVEASGKRELSSGVRGVAIRIARYVNDLLMRRGRFWADRWFGRALRSPREVRHALAYVLSNFRKHAGRALPPGIDPYSSGGWFEGWREWHPGARVAPRFAARPPPRVSVSDCGGATELQSRPSSPPTQWLTTVGWRRHGLLSWSEQPAESPLHTPARHHPRADPAQPTPRNRSQPTLRSRL